MTPEYRVLLNLDNFDTLVKVLESYLISFPYSTNNVEKVSKLVSVEELQVISKLSYLEIVPTKLPC